MAEPMETTSASEESPQEEVLQQEGGGEGVEREGGEEEVVEEDVEGAEGAKSEGNAAYSSGNYRDAVEAYTRAIGLAPSVATYYANRAQAYIKLEDYGRGAEDAEAALERDPGYMKAYLRAGTCYRMMGMFSKAKAAFRHVTQVDADNATARSELGLVDVAVQDIAQGREMLEAGNPRSAFSAFKSAQRVAPLSHTVLMGIAETYLALGQYGDASGMASRVLRETGDRNVEALYVRGMAHYYLENFDLASNHFRTGVQYDPDHAKCMRMLKRVRKLTKVKAAGNAAFKARDFTGAVDAFSEALALDPDHKSYNAKLHANRAAAYLKLGALDEAEQDCSQAITLDPEYAKAFARRGSIRLQKELYQEAVYDYERATSLDPESRNFQSELRKAKKELKKSLRKDLYKILEVPKSASGAEIKKAYRKLARKWHPDKLATKSDEEKAKAEVIFKDIQLAYGILSDTEKRAQYDEGFEVSDIDNGTAGHNPFGGGGFGGGFGGGGFGGGGIPEDIFAQMFGGGMGGGRGGFHF